MNISKIFLILLITVKLFAFDDVYFLPEDNNLAKNKILKLIKNSKKSIDIAIYNINYKKFILELNKASNRGVVINIFYHKKKGNFHKNIKLSKTRSKLHTKIAIFDKKIVYYGSANWKKKSFKQNYEIINITNNNIKVKKFNNFFTKLTKENN